jgi:hypothetical protein
MAPEGTLILPPAIIYGILLFGAVLALLKPYWALLLGVALPIGMSNPTLVFSRLPGLGAYFNTQDACLLICVASAITDGIQRRRRVTVPLVPAVMILILFVGYVNATLSYGQAYESLRALRWGVSVPLYYIIVANVVTSESRAKVLFCVLFVAAIAGAMQHVYDVFNRYDAMVGDEESLRTTAFQFAHTESWLVAGPMFVAGRLPYLWVQIGAGFLFLVELVLSQTRSIAIGATLAALVYYGWLVPGSFVEKLRRLRALVVIVFVGLMVVVPWSGLSGFVESYSGRIARTSVEDTSTRSRAVSIQVELENWLNGNVLLGQGLGYHYVQEFTRYKRNVTEDVAYGHIGYTTYLAQLGLLGFFVYGVWFPFTTIRMAKRVRANTKYSVLTRHLGGVGGALSLYCVFLFGLSGSFLSPEVLPGVLSGFFYAATRNEANPDKSKSVKNALLIRNA